MVADDSIFPKMIFASLLHTWSGHRCTPRFLQSHLVYADALSTTMSHPFIRVSHALPPAAQYTLALAPLEPQLATKKNKMTRFGINVAGGGGTGKNASGGILSTPSSPGSGRSSGGTAGDGGSRRRHPYSAVSVSSFSSEDREQTLQILLSRERVLSLLYDRTFPLSAPPRPTEKGDEGASTAVGGGGAPAGGGAGGGDMGA